MLPHICRPLVCQVLQIFIHYVDLVKAAKKWRVGLFSIYTFTISSGAWKLCKLCMPLPCKYDSWTICPFVHRIMLSNGVLRNYDWTIIICQENNALQQGAWGHDWAAHNLRSQMKIGWIALPCLNAYLNNNNSRIIIRVVIIIEEETTTGSLAPLCRSIDLYYIE